MFLLDHPIRNYPWGSPTAISEFLNIPSDGKPQAEMWIGAHPDDPCTVVTPDSIHSDKETSHDLNTLISQNPEKMLGAEAVDKFGPELPYLLKVLAAQSPLSLQVHPTQAQAKKGFLRENAQGLPPDDPHRNYKDEHHKPEVIVAVTDFEALSGFKSPQESQQIFTLLLDYIRDHHHDNPHSGEWIEFTKTLEKILNDSETSEEHRIERGFTYALEYLSENNSHSHELFNALFPLKTTENNDVEPSNGNHSALSLTDYAHNHNSSSEDSRIIDSLVTANLLRQKYPYDPGVFLSLLLNKVHLKPGEAISLPAGNIHAYLHGLGIEAMASSDNVLRGGLTEKHIDIPELLKTLDFTPLPVPRLDPHHISDNKIQYRPDFDEFLLEKITLNPDHSSSMVEHNGPTIILCTQGHIDVTAPSDNNNEKNSQCAISQGQSVFIPAENTHLTIELGQTKDSSQKQATAYCITIPRNKPSENL